MAAWILAPPILRLRAMSPLPHLTRSWWLAALGGACLGFASSRSWLWPLAILGAAIWTRAIAISWHRTMDSFGLVLVGSLSMHACAVSWIFNGLSRNGGNSPSTVALLAVLFFGGLATLHAICFGIARVLIKSRGLRNERGAFVLVCLVAWSANEWARQSGQFAFPYLQLATMLIDAPGTTGWLPVIGAEGLSVLVLAPLAWGSGSVLATDTRHRSGRDWRKVLYALSMLALAGIALREIDWTQATAGERQRVFGMQSNFTRASKWTDASRAHAFEWVRRVARSAPAGAVLITPEFFLFDPVQLTPAKELEALQDLARQQNVELLIGVPYAVKPFPVEIQTPERPGPQFQVFNSVMQLSPYREDLYGKGRLVPYGEYAPLARWLAPIYRDVFDFPLNNLSPAPEQLQENLFVAGKIVGASICFELAFPQVMAQRALNAQWLFTVTNNGWFDSDVLNAQTHIIARVRAAETGKMLLAVNNVGITALHGAEGQVVSELAPHKEDILVADLVPYVGSTPYGQLSSRLPGASSSLAVLFVFAVLRKRVTHQKPTAA